MTKSTKPVATVLTFAAVAPTFATEGKEFKELIAQWDAAGAAFTTGTTVLLAGYADKCRTTSGLSKITLENVKASIKSIRTAIMEDETVVEMMCTGVVPKATFSNYAQSVCRAWFHGIDYAPGLFNKPELAIPGLRTQAAPAKNASKKAGKVTTTESEAGEAMAELSGSLEKATKMYISFLRAHGANELADAVSELFAE